MESKVIAVTMGTVMMAALAVGCNAGEEGLEAPVETAPAGAPDEMVGASQSALVLCGVERPDWFVSKVLTNGNWGTWAECPSFCPTGSYAYGFTHKSEVISDIGDNTALNGIKLNCNSRATGAWTANVTSSTGPWGSWMSVGMCPNTGAPMVSGNVLLESPQGILDDTAANKMSTTCADGTQVTPQGISTWGSWRGWVSCPAGTAVCGIKTRVEGNQGADDDSSLNGIELECCTFQ